MIKRPSLRIPQILTQDLVQLLGEGHIIRRSSRALRADTEAICRSYNMGSGMRYKLGSHMDRSELHTG